MNATGIPIWYIFNQSDMCSTDQPERVLIKTVNMNHSIAYVPEKNVELLREQMTRLQADWESERDYADQMETKEKRAVAENAKLRGLCIDMFKTIYYLCGWKYANSEYRKQIHELGIEVAE